MSVGSVRSVLMMAVLLCGLPRAAVARLPDPWSSYHTTDEILSDFSRMAEEHPRWMRWERVGDRVDVATITDSEEPDDDKARLLLVFGEHARELITAELALWLARVLVENNRNYVRGASFEPFRAIFGDSIITTDGEVWRPLRRMAQPAFHRAALAPLAEIVAVPDTAFDGAALLVSVTGHGFEAIKLALIKAGASVRSSALVGSHATRYTVPSNGSAKS